MPAEGPLRDRNGPGFALIETLRWEPESGFLRLDRHLARLAASASALGFALEIDEAQQALGNVAHGAQPKRVRLELAADGTCSVTAALFEPLSAGAIWKLSIATSAKLDSADPLLRHKTTRRGVYATARAEFPRDVADEVILLNERGEICEGTITSVFVQPVGGAPLLTPSLSCGLLAGVLRGDLLDDGRAIEAVLTPRDLAEASAVFVGNSLRGLIRARLI